MVPLIATSIVAVLVQISPSPATPEPAVPDAEIVREESVEEIPIRPRESEPAATHNPTPYAPLDDRSVDRPELSGVLSETEMLVLIDSYFEPDRRLWALNVAWCESRFDTRAKNPRSGAAGLWQFLRSTWDWVAGETGTGSYDSGAVFDPYAQALNAAWLVENEGSFHWVCRG